MSATDIDLPNTADERRADRVSTELKTIVQVKEGDGETWKEVTRVTTVSRNGAGFSMSRPVTVGRIVTLVMPLAPELRAYDTNTELYPVLGIVQYCNAGMVDGKDVHHVGVGFIGKNVPESFKSDPRQSYRITGMGKDGLWTIAEADTAFKARRHPRFWLAVDVTLTVIRKENRTVDKEDTVTQNVAASGLSVLSSLEAEVGDKVKVAFRSLDFFAVAIVRNRKQKKDQMPTLHLEFVDALFPVDKLITVPEHPSQPAPPPRRSDYGPIEFRGF